MKQSEPTLRQFKIIRYPLVDSTNRIALDLGRKGSAHGTVIFAQEQTGGRGRQARFFFSPPGGVYMSALLRPHLPVDKLSLITLAAGAACAEAIEMFTGIPVYLKWPNDLYSNNKKLGGILTETAPYSPAGKGVPFVVVGIGMNVNTRAESFPESLQDLATSLYCVTGQEYEVEEILHCTMKALLEKVSLLQTSPQKVLEHWRKKDFMWGKELSWQDSKGSVIHGVGNGLLSDGRYRLTTFKGEDYPVLAGDITVTDINGQSIR